MLSRHNNSTQKPPTYFLYGQSTLRRFNIKFEVLGKITPFILKTESFKKVQIISPISGCEFYVEQIQDICEKLDFLRVCLTTINHLEKHIDSGVFVFHVEEAKFFFYTFIYNLKALMDSISMLLREIFKLSSFRKGNIDIVRKQQYREAVSQSSSQINQFLRENANWLSIILEFRDRLIHRHRIPIFIKDKYSHAVFWVQFLETSKEGKRYHVLDITGKKVPKLSFKNEKIGLKKPFAYVYFKQPITLQEILNKKPLLHPPKDFKPLYDFCSDSFNLSTKLIELVLTELLAILSKK